jgi:long-chain acyl-CoA synthetase
MFIHDFLARAASFYGDAPAVVDGETRLTYRQLDGRVRRLAAALQGLGLRHGDVVACLSLNGFRTMEAFLAASLAGVAVAPINTRLAPPETAFILNDGGAAVLLLQAAFLPHLESVRAELKTLRHIVVLDGADGPDVLGYEGLLERADPARLRLRAWDADDLAQLCYTGGTTGLPKGVMLTQRNVVANALHAIQFMELNERDVWLHAAPMFHLADSWACCSLTALGALHVFMERFAPDTALALIQRHAITATSIVPTMINQMLEVPGAEATRLASLRRVAYGAAPMPVERVKSAVALLGPVLQQCYGQSEASPFLTATTLRGTLFDDSERGRRRLGSCGQAILGVELNVVNPKGEAVGVGEVGEVIARGPNVMRGYWNRPQETAAALRDGWLHTGDLATWDDERWVTIVDRAKDVIISGGENIYSTEVEAALYKHPAVLEAAVIGVPDDRWGESVKAVVVLRPGQTAGAGEIVAHCRHWIARYKCPRSVEFLPSLPKSGAGKVLKSELRKPYWEGQARRVH